MSPTQAEPLQTVPSASVWKSPAGLHFVVTVTVLTVFLVSVINAIGDRAHSLSESRISNTLIAGLAVQQTQRVLTAADAVIADLAHPASSPAHGISPTPAAMPDGIRAIRLLAGPGSRPSGRDGSGRDTVPERDVPWTTERIVAGSTVVRALVALDPNWLERRYNELRAGSTVTVALFDARHQVIAIAGPSSADVTPGWAQGGDHGACLCTVTPLAGAPFVVVAGKPWSGALKSWYASTARLAVATSMIICILMALSVRVERLEGREAKRLAYLSNSIARLSRQVDRASLFRQVETDASALIGRNRTCTVVAQGAGYKGQRFALLTHDGTIQNVLVVGDRKRRPLTAIERLSLEQLAYSASHALDVIRLLEERRAEVETVTALHKVAEQSRAHIEAVFAAMPDAVMTMDHAWRVVFANREARALLALETDGRIAASLWDLLPPPVQEQVETALRHAVETGSDMSSQVRWPSPTAADVTAPERWIVLRGVSHTLGMTLLMQDVSQQIETDNRLRQTAKMEAIGHLTGGIAHDFNNLLTVIMGNLELLEIDGGIPTPDAEALSDALRAARGAADLTHQLLAFARKQPLAPKQVDVPLLLREMTGLLKSSAGPAIAVSIAVDCPHCHALIDQPQLQNALINLVVNARDAMPNGGTLAIRVTEAAIGPDDPLRDEGLEPGTYVRIDIADSGHGIAAKDLPHVFEPFFTTKQVGAGTGLGLSMVYGFVKQSRGHAFISSTVGAGTTMTLLLPRSDARAQAAVSGTRDAAPPPGRGETVLLVEDVDLVREQTARMLGRLNYVVIEAADARKALEIVACGATPDLLLTDLGLPGGIDGHELAVRICGMLPGLPLLFVSGYADSEMLAGQLIVPGGNLLLKPFSFLALGSHIESVLRKKRNMARYV